MVMIDLLVALAAGQHHLFGIDDDDIVAIVHMRREGRLVLAAQPHGDERGEAPDDEALGVDQHPFLFDLRRLGGISMAEHANFHGNRRKAPSRSRIDWRFF